MKIQSDSKSQRPPVNFDLFRLTASKREVDLSPNTIRSYGKLGLGIYKRGKCCFVSKEELKTFIRSQFVNASVVGTTPRQNSMKEAA